MCPQKESKEPKMYTTGNYDSRSEDETFFDNGLTGLLGYPGVLWHIKEIQKSSAPEKYSPANVAIGDDQNELRVSWTYDC